MNKKLFNVLLFTAGAAVGSLVTWKGLKTKYEQLIQEEVDTFKEEYARCMDRGSTEVDTCEDGEDYQCDEGDDDTTPDFDDGEMIDYHRLASKYQESSKVAENSGEGEGDKEAPYINGPYVIAPNDFGDGNYDYEMHCLTYYADGVLANDWDEQLDIDETIGLESLEHFGDYAEDVVHVRNERLEADYEVVRDCRSYADILAMSSPSRIYAD